MAGKYPGWVGGDGGELLDGWILITRFVERPAPGEPERRNCGFSASTSNPVRRPLLPQVAPRRFSTTSYCFEVRFMAQHKRPDD
jgi:hypothetical protein